MPPHLTEHCSDDCLLLVLLTTDLQSFSRLHYCPLQTPGSRASVQRELKCEAQFTSKKLDPLVSKCQ